MRILLRTFYIVALLLHTISAEESEESWAWGSKDKKEEKIEGRQNSEQPIYYDTDVAEDQLILNDTEVEGLIDEILSSTRQGRNLKGYDEVYTDPDVQDAIQKGDESEARNVIKERLCALGLVGVIF